MIIDDIFAFNVDLNITQNNDDSKLLSVKNCQKERTGQNGKRLYKQS